LVGIYPALEARGGIRGAHARALVNECTELALCACELRDAMRTQMEHLLRIDTDRWDVYDFVLFIFDSKPLELLRATHGAGMTSSSVADRCGCPPAHPPRRALPAPDQSQAPGHGDAASGERPTADVAAPACAAIVEAESGIDGGDPGAVRTDAGCDGCTDAARGDDASAGPSSCHAPRADTSEAGGQVNELSPLQRLGDLIRLDSQCLGWDKHLQPDSTLLRLLKYNSRTGDVERAALVEPWDEGSSAFAITLTISRCVSGRTRVDSISAAEVRLRALA